MDYASGSTYNSHLSTKKIKTNYYCNQDLWIKTKEKIIIVLKNCHNQKLRRCRPFIHTFFRLFSALNGIFILVFDFFLFVLLNLWPPLDPPIQLIVQGLVMKFLAKISCFWTCRKICQIEVSYSSVCKWSLQFDEFFCLV